MKRDGKVIGWGVGGASWAAARVPCTASVELCQNGRVCVRCATQDIGTGTYTIFAQVVHAKTGVPLDKIDVFLGDTALPDGPTSGGSMVTSAMLPATTMAVNQAVRGLSTSRRCCPNSPFHGAHPDSLTLAQGRDQDERRRGAGEDRRRCLSTAAPISPPTACPSKKCCGWPT